MRDRVVTRLIRQLHLWDFKSFSRAQVDLGPFTTLIGTNASGKSNLRDAFRFLHGVGRGYTLAEILGGKWGESGTPVWRGIRGGVKELTYKNPEVKPEDDWMLLRVSFGENGRLSTYRIGLRIDQVGDVLSPTIVEESFYVGSFEIFAAVDSQPDHPGHIRAQVYTGHNPMKLSLLSDRPLLGQVAAHPRVSKLVRTECITARETLSAMRFLELVPEAMRSPSTPGQKILSDRGENLSSVLQTISRDEHAWAALLGWLRELTPQDVTSVEFTADQEGKILAHLLERDGKRISAYSASDGTLRFLAILAAVFSPEPTGLYFFEEIENGVHPTRLHLLAQVMEQQAQRQAPNLGVQIVATSHSPLLLSFLNERSISDASLVCRLPEDGPSVVKRLVDVPSFASARDRVGIANLHESGWFETVTRSLEVEDE